MKWGKLLGLCVLSAGRWMTPGIFLLVVSIWLIPELVSISLLITITGALAGAFMTFIRGIKNAFKLSQVDIEMLETSKPAEVAQVKKRLVVLASLLRLNSKFKSDLLLWSPILIYMARSDRFDIVFKIMQACVEGGEYSRKKLVGFLTYLVYKKK